MGRTKIKPVPRPKVHLVDPTPLLVTHQAQLDKLVGMYVHCLQNNLVPNILAELYLLLELLTVKNNSLEGMHRNGYLGSVHNCVYFATHVLDSKAGQTLLCGPDR